MQFKWKHSIQWRPINMIQLCALHIYNLQCSRAILWLKMKINFTFDVRATSETLATIVSPTISIYFNWKIFRILFWKIGQHAHDPKRWKHNKEHTRAKQRISSSSGNIWLPDPIQDSIVANGRQQLAINWAFCSYFKDGFNNLFCHFVDNSLCKSHILKNRLHCW